MHKIKVTVCFIHLIYHCSVRIIYRFFGINMYTVTIIHIHAAYPIRSSERL